MTVPYDDPDPTDPMTLHGVGIATDTDEADRVMATCFIEEYLRLGFDRERLLKLFQTKGYAGPHRALQTLGEDVIVKLIDEQVARWGRRLPSHPLQANSQGELQLPVLDS